MRFRHTSALMILAASVTLGACQNEEDTASAEELAAVPSQEQASAVPEVPDAPMFSSGAPDCAGDEARAAIVDLARAAPNNKLVVHVREMVVNENWNKFHKKIIGMEEALEQQSNIRTEFNRNVNNGSYSLSSIRTTSKDESVKASTCAANLKFELSGFGWAEYSITYKLETTSEGNIYATLYGI